MPAAQDWSAEEQRAHDHRRADDRDRDRRNGNVTAGGTFSGNRSSSPYAAPWAQSRANSPRVPRMHATAVRRPWPRTRRRATRERSRHTASDAECQGHAEACDGDGPWAWRPAWRAARWSIRPRRVPRRRCGGRGPRRDRVGEGAARGHGQADPDGAQKPDIHRWKRAPLRRVRTRRSYTTKPMAPSLHGGVFPTGLATGIGSLPFADARDAAALVLRALPDLPAIPQLASPREGVVAQWADALPEVSIAPDGSLVVDAATASAIRSTRSSPRSPTQACSAFSTPPRSPREPRSTGEGAGGRTAHARCRARRAGIDRRSRVRARAGDGRRPGSVRSRQLLARRLPWRAPVALPRRAGAWCSGRATTDRSSGRPRSTCCRARSRPCRSRPVSTSAATATSGSPSKPARPCSACRSRPASSTTSVRSSATSTPTAGSRGAQSPPTDPSANRPTRCGGELVELWCELTRRGCEPLRIRSQAIITPACGLVNHGPTPGRARVATRVGARGARRRPRAPRPDSPPARKPAAAHSAGPPVVAGPV